ncbi:MAG: NAD(P)H-dependent oxidoreductase subunit E, partial [Anaerolineales bacterium]
MGYDPPVSSQLTEFLEKHGSRGREMLLPALLETQKVHDYIPARSAAYISEVLKVPLAEIYGVIEFYSMLSSQPRAEKVIRICTTPSCA